MPVTSIAIVLAEVDERSSDTGRTSKDSETDWDTLIFFHKPYLESR